MELFMQIDPKDLELIGEFTYRFLRFERYLIDSNFYNSNKRGYLYPDYSKYCSEKLNSVLKISDLTSFPELKNVISKRLIDKNGKIDWIEVATESHTVFDFLLKVDVVRDNLFHGSKVLDDKDRDIMLIKESINFLKHIEQHDYEYGKYI